MVTDKSGSSPKSLIGLFGGTFDPVHLGHINAVTELQSEVAFEAIHWVLSARPPHKHTTSASIDQRYEMLALALADHPVFHPDDSEIRRTEKSWTIDTVLEFKQRFPTLHPCLIIGGDSLLKLETWHRYEELIELASFVVMARPGYPLDIPKAMRARQVQTAAQLRTRVSAGLLLIEQTNYPISSTEIRALFDRNGDSDTAHMALESMLPSPVIRYIQQYQPYTTLPMQPEQIKAHVVDALEDIKGQDIRVLDIADISDFADFMVVASGTSDTHVKALAREASDRLRGLGVKPLNEDGQELGEWVLVDFGDVVLHVMRPEVREYYDLEKLWDQDVREMVKQHREQQDD